MSFFQWYWLMTIVFLILYGALILWFSNGWNSIELFKPGKSVFNLKITVIVPFHNEESVLDNCLRSIVNQKIQTGLVEIIAINDHSTDNSVHIASKYAEKYMRVQLINATERGKKQALLQAISEAKGDIIVTTDADCTHHEHWLMHIAAYFTEYSPKLLAGGVKYRNADSIFQKFQQMELLSYVTSGAGAIGINHAIMCNGANMAFSKSAFNEFEDPYNLKYLSGDDVFLLHAMKKKYNNDIHFIKSEETVVETQSSKTFKEYVRRKARWASKAKGYYDNDTKFTGAVVLAVNLLLVCGILAIPFKIVFYIPVLVILGVKTATDWHFLKQSANLFKSVNLLSLSPYFELIHAFIVAYSAVVGFYSKKRW